MRRPSRGENRVLQRETAKLVLRRILLKKHLEIGADPFVAQVARMLRSRGISTVIDVGANVGQYARLLRSAGFGGRVVSLEPLSIPFEALQKRAAHDPQWTAIRSAVGAAPGEVDINVSANLVSSSVRSMTRAHLEAAPNSGYLATERVPMTTVAALLSEHALAPETTFLKIDVQGFEREVLEGTGAFIGALAGLQIELSFRELYEGQTLIRNEIEELRSHGFELFNLSPGIAAPDGRLLQCDGVFVRSGRV